MKCPKHQTKMTGVYLKTYDATVYSCRSGKPDKCSVVISVPGKVEHDDNSRLNHKHNV